MIRTAFLASAAALALAACSEPAPRTDSELDIPPPTAQMLSGAGLYDTPSTPWEALKPFYDQLEYDPPVAPAGPPPPAVDTPLRSIAFGSCNTAEREIPILQTIASQDHDLFIYAGDNVYGDARAYDATLPELREAYRQLAARPEFQALRAAFPMLATWDDHDYGMNDLGADFPFKGFAETLFLDFWRAAADDPRRTRPGVYDSHMFGPEGQRTQIILLDTRYFRTGLTPTDERGAPGRERYLPSADSEQSMLGADQWAWLEAQLRQPADLRLVVSSIQVHADGHGWEAWRTMPLERRRLYDLVTQTGANGVVFLSGDRHSSGLYVRDDVAPYPLYEITSSALNMSFAEENNEAGPHRIGDMYAPVNFGVIAIDWAGGQLALQIKDEAGEVVREQRIPLAALGAR